MNITAEAEAGIAHWSLEIREPQAPYLPFYHREGQDDPPSQIVWDGRNDSGELVQSASEYPYILRVTDIQGNESIYAGVIEIDVLVIRDGDLLRVQVPSIIFAANQGDFSGLSEEDAETNERILRRIAEVLNKFVSYKVLVEGHANFTAQTPALRQREQERELKPLSEKRAQAVVDRLVEYGVDRERLRSVGVGGDRPITPYEDRDGWWKNRRVEFILEKSGEPDQSP
jgi:hypothetical protein